MEELGSCLNKGGEVKRGLNLILFQKMSSFFVIFKINLSAIPVYSKYRIKKKSQCKGDLFPRVGLDKVICTGSSATFQKSFFFL